MELIAAYMSMMLCEIGVVLSAVWLAVDHEPDCAAAPMALFITSIFGFRLFLTEVRKARAEERGDDPREE